jgi:hypothetical protein
MPFPVHMQRKDLVAGQGCYNAVACMHISQYVSNGWGVGWCFWGFLGKNASILKARARCDGKPISHMHKVWVMIGNIAHLEFFGSLGLLAHAKVFLTVFFAV